MTPEMNNEYRKLLSSSYWKKFRVMLIKLRGGKCEVCGANYSLEVHHKTYERLGKERLEDVSVLCHTHHLEADIKRAAEGRSRSQMALESACYNSGLDTWLEKRGCNTDYMTCSEIDREIEEFDDWCERKSLAY